MSTDDAHARWAEYVELSEAAAQEHLVIHGPPGARIPELGDPRVREEGALLREVQWRPGDHPCRYCAGAGLRDGRRR